MVTYYFGDPRAALSPTDNSVSIDQIHFFHSTVGTVVSCEVRTKKGAVTSASRFDLWKYLPDHVT